MSINFSEFTSAIFGKKADWDKVTNNDKEKMFFIFNQYMAKKDPMRAQFFNEKGTDVVIALEIWKQFNKNSSGTPFWFWKGKRTIEKSEEDLLVEEITKLYDLDKYEIFYLKRYEKELYLQMINEFKSDKEIENKKVTKKKNENKTVKRRK